MNPEHSEPGEIVQPSRNRRAVVSVAFAAKDFQRVGAAAKRAQMPVSAYIRKAALEQAQSASAVHSWTSSNRNRVVLFVTDSVTTD